MKKCFTLQERVIIEALLKQGESHRAIAAIIGRSKSSISGELQRRSGPNGYEARGAQAIFELNKKQRIEKLTRKFSQGELDHIKQSREKGMSIDQIAVELGAGSNSIRQILNTLSYQKPQNTTGTIERLWAVEQQIKIIFELIEEIRNNGKNK